MTMPDASMSPTVSHDQDPLLTPIESLLEMAAPGKESDQEAENLQMVLDGMRDGDLLELVSLAYQEDPEANSLLLSKATAILDERGKSGEAQNLVQVLMKDQYRELLDASLRRSPSLSLLAGSELYDLLTEHTTQEALLEYGRSAVNSALEGVEGAVDLLSLDPSSTEALNQFASALAQDGAAQADKFLSSEKGQKLLGKISQFVQDKPGHVLLIGVLAAAGAVAADLDIRGLKSTFKIHDSLTAKVSANLGSLRNVALKSIKASLHHVSGRFRATAGVEHKQDKGQTYNASARYGTDEDFIGAEGTIDPQGNLMVELDAAIQAHLFSASASATHDTETDASTADVKVAVGNDQNRLTTSGTLNADGDLLVSIGSEFRFSEHSNASLDFTGNYGQQSTQSIAGQYRFNQDLGFDLNAQETEGRWGGSLGTTRYFEGGTSRSYIGDGLGGLHIGNAFQYREGGTSFGLDTKDVGADGTLDAVDLNLSLSPTELASFTLAYGRSLDGSQSASSSLDIGNDQFKGHLGYTFSGNEHVIEGGIGGEFHEDWEYDLASSYNITSRELESIHAKLGFRDPDEFRAFSIEFSRTQSGGNSEASLSSSFETTLGQYYIRNTGSLHAENDQFSGVSNNLQIARPIDDTWKAIVGATVDYDHFSGQTNAVPQIGLQYKQIPLVLSYDFQTNTPMLGITLPFGRR